MRRRGKLESQKADRLSYGSRLHRSGGNFQERVRRPAVLMLSSSNQREGDGKEEIEKLHSLKLNGKGEVGCRGRVAMSRVLQRKHSHE